MTQPNILWICTDQQRGDTIHALGNPSIRTPSLDRLAAEGTAFSRAYCQSPICTPSRASFLTGKYASTVRCSRNGNAYWDEAAPIVPRLLRDAGYTCGLVGKLHLAGAAGRIEPRPRDDGYSTFEWSHSARDDWRDGHAYAAWVRAQGEDLGELRRRLGHIPAELHQTKWCADRAIRFIHEQRAGRPWLLSVNIWDPHKPFDPPPEYLERYAGKALPGPHFRESDLATQAALAEVEFQTSPRRPDELKATEQIARYYAMVEQIDHHVGRMLDALVETGQRGNTLVMFMSDHGEMLGDHGLLLKGCRFYEGLTRVPLILSLPGMVTEGAISDGLVELTDLAPTLLELAGRPAEAGMVGQSLVPALTRGARPTREHVRSEYYAALNPRLLGKTGPSTTYGTMFRDERFKLCVYHGYGLGELYDLEEDPHEHQNLWSDPGYRGLREELLLRSYDATVRAVDLGPPQTCDF